MIQGDAEALTAEVVRARAHLADAAASADLAGIADALDELERIHSLAGESGIELPHPATAAGAVDATAAGTVNVQTDSSEADSSDTPTTPTPTPKEP